ncbi:MAG: LapA family protein [Desulfobacteraceae bacterium]|jgi:uncharacterized integral membrane protein
MKKIKIAFWVIVIGFLTLLMIQNKDFFFSKNSFNLDFYFRKYTTPEVPNALLFLAFFFVGLLIAYVFGLLGQYKSKRTVKDLKATMQAQMKVITDLKSDIVAKDAQIEQLSKVEETAISSTTSPETVVEPSVASSIEDTVPVEVDDPTVEEEKKNS